MEVTLFSEREGSDRWRTKKRGEKRGGSRTVNEQCHQRFKHALFPVKKKEKKDAERESWSVSERGLEGGTQRLKEGPCNAVDDRKAHLSKLKILIF